MDAVTGHESFREAARKLGRDGEHQFRRRMPAHTESLEPATEIPARSLPPGAGRAAFRLALALAILAGVSLSVANLFGDWFSRAEHSGDKTVREIVIGNDVMRVAGNHIRFNAQRRDGPQERLDLQLHWPDFEGYGTRLAPLFDSAGTEPSIVYLTIERRSMRLDMSGRIEPIYAKFFDGPEENARHGLLKRKLSPGQGFIDEDLYYEAASPYPFAARCIRQNSELAAPFCIRDIHAGRDLAVTYRFHASLIGEWMPLDAAIRQTLNSMIAR